MLHVNTSVHYYRVSYFQVIYSDNGGGKCNFSSLLFGIGKETYITWCPNKNGANIVDQILVNSSNEKCLARTAHILIPEVYRLPRTTLTFVVARQLKEGIEKL